MVVKGLGWGEVGLMELKVTKKHEPGSELGGVRGAGGDPNKQTK